MTEATLAPVMGPSSTGEKLGGAEVRGQGATKGALIFQHQESQASFQTEVGRGQNSLEQRTRPKPSSMAAIGGDKRPQQHGPPEAYGGATAFQAAKPGSVESSKANGFMEQKEARLHKAVIAAPSGREDAKAQQLTRAPESRKRTKEGEAAASQQEAAAGENVASAAVHSGSSRKVGQPGLQSPS